MVEERPRGRRQLADGADAGGGQLGPGRRPYPPYQPHRQAGQEPRLVVGFHHDQAIGLGHLGSHFGQVFGAGHADRQRQPDLFPDAPADGGGDGDRRPEEASGTGHLEERLVDGDSFDHRREGGQDVHDFVAEALVLPEMPGNEGQVRAQLARPPCRHPGRDAERPGLVGRRQHDPGAHGYRPPGERGIEQLLGRGVKRV